jgi:hypothetical protein
VARALTVMVTSALQGKIRVKPYIEGGYDEMCIAVKCFVQENLWSLLRKLSTQTSHSKAPTNVTVQWLNPVYL